MSYVTSRQLRVPLIVQGTELVCSVGPNDLVSKIIVEVSRPTTVTLTIESQYLSVTIVQNQAVMPSAPLWVQRSYVGTLTEASLFITTTDVTDCFITVVIETLCN